MNKNQELVDDVLERGVANIIPSKTELKAKLESGDTLKIYLGIDPTATRIHLGHAVLLRKLQKLAELGHQVTFLIGDFTALIGDTSDKDGERPQLTVEQVKQNFADYEKQAKRIIDFSKVTLVYNSTWLRQLTLGDVIRLTQHFSAGDFVGRELIKKRLEGGKKVGLHELLYPVMQGYDSYHLDADLQLGGTDQTFNMQTGRTLQKDLRNKNSFVLACEFLPGTDGRKMSKSWDNAIWVGDEPDEMFGKIMSLRDDLIVTYLTLATDLPSKKVDQLNEQLNQQKLAPMEAKKQLALEVVKQLHSSEAAMAARAEFEQVFQKRQIPSQIPTVDIGKQPLSITEALVTAGTASSKSEAKTLVAQGAVTVDGEKITDVNFVITPKSGAVIAVGKRRFIKID